MAYNNPRPGLAEIERSVRTGEASRITPTPTVAREQGLPVPEAAEILRELREVLLDGSVEIIGE